MLGRKDYTPEELDRCKAVLAEQLAAYHTLVKATGNASEGEEAGAALAAFEPRFFNNMVLVLDRFFVHRLRTVTGKDGNPLNEVEMLTDSLINNNGVLRGINVIKYVPDQSVLKLSIGDRINLTAADFERLSAAFLAEIEEKFV
jgi:hypothetical protein